VQHGQQASDVASVGQLAGFPADSAVCALALHGDAAHPEVVRPVARAQALRAQAEEAWQLVCALGDEPDGTLERLDALRGAYTDLYTEAEALAHSSIAAARTAPAASNGQLPGAARWLIARARPLQAAGPAAPARARDPHAAQRLTRE
jgi:hypothetical protein